MNPRWIGLLILLAGLGWLIAGTTGLVLGAVIAAALGLL